MARWNALVSLGMPLRHCASHEQMAFDNVSEMIGHALDREETEGDSSEHIYLYFISVGRMTLVVRSGAASRKSRRPRTK